MSSPALVLNANNFLNANNCQGLTPEQLKQLNAIASMAKGSRFFEGSKGGNGFMGSFVDETTGRTHYIKMLTKSGEREKAYNGETEITGNNEADFLKTDSGARLKTMSTGLKADLLALAKQVRVDGDLRNLFNSSKNKFQILMTRKIVAQAVSLIKDAHNKMVGADSKRSFSWKNVAHAGTEEHTTLSAVFNDIDSTNLVSHNGMRRTAIAGKSYQQRMEATLKNPSPSKEDIRAFIDNFRKGHCPSAWDGDLKNILSIVKDRTTSVTDMRDTIVNLLEAALKDPNLPRSQDRNALASAWRSVKTAVKCFHLTPLNERSDKHTVEKQLKLLVGLGNLVGNKNLLGEGFAKNLSDFAKKCVKEGFADILLKGIAQGEIKNMQECEDKFNKLQAKEPQNIEPKKQDVKPVNQNAEQPQVVEQEKPEVNLVNQKDNKAQVNVVLSLLNDLAKELKVDENYQSVDNELVENISNRMRTIKGEIDAYKKVLEKQENALGKCKNAIEEYKMDVDKNPDPAKGEALMRQQNELEKEIANLHGLIFKRGTVLKEVKKELTSAQVRLAEFNNLPKDAQLVVKAMEVIKAFDEDRLKLKPGDENEIDWIIGALSGCNGTTDVRKTLTALKANVEALAETPEVKARLIAAENANP